MGDRRDNIQYGALPYSVGHDGELRILLVTSRGTRRWVIPKGWPMKLRRPHEAAAREAFEEAGVIGKSKKRPIGVYEYDKKLDDGAEIRCSVKVFPLPVARLNNRWPEADQRERRWFSPQEAAGLVDEPGLAAMLLGYHPKS